MHWQCNARRRHSMELSSNPARGRCMGFSWMLTNNRLKHQPYYNGIGSFLYAFVTSSFRLFTNSIYHSYGYGELLNESKCRRVIVVPIEINSINVLLPYEALALVMAMQFAIATACSPHNAFNAQSSSSASWCPWFGAKMKGVDSSIVYFVCTNGDDDGKTMVCHWLLCLYSWGPIHRERERTYSVRRTHTHTKCQISTDSVHLWIQYKCMWQHFNDFRIIALCIRTHIYR